MATFCPKFHYWHCLTIDKAWEGNLEKPARLNYILKISNWKRNPSGLPPKLLPEQNIASSLALAISLPSHEHVSSDEHWVRTGSQVDRPSNQRGLLQACESHRYQMKQKKVKAGFMDEPSLKQEHQNKPLNTHTSTVAQHWEAQPSLPHDQQNQPLTPTSKWPLFCSSMLFLYNSLKNGMRPYMK